MDDTVNKKLNGEENMGKEHWLPEESLLHGKYSIQKVLGQGGFGITYLAYDNTLQQEVAIKEYFPIRYADRLSNRLSDFVNEKSEASDVEEIHLSATSIVYPQTGQEKRYLKGMKDFLEEARLLFVRFDIEGIVAIRDFFEENGTAYIVMEYLSGMTLRQYEKQYKGKISEKQASVLLEPVVKALSYLHSNGIVHCDISPDNLLFDREGSLRLIDFGAARRSEKQKDETYYKGSYTAPEQYYDTTIIGPWTDIYAFCAVWYEMLTGNKVPNAIERLDKDRLKNISTLAEVSPQTEEIIHRGLSLEISKRYFSATNLYFDFRKNNDKTDNSAIQSGKEETTINTELEKYMADTRKIWGNLWLKITTDISEKNVTQKGKWISGRRVKRGMRVFTIIFALTIFTRIGGEMYIQTNPEKYFTYKVKKQKEYYLLHPRENEYTNKNPEYTELVKNVRKLAYTKKEEEKDAYYQYELSEKNLKKLGLISNKYGILALSEKNMEKAISAFMQLKRSEIESISTNFESVIYRKRRIGQSELEVDAKKQKDITYTNRERIKITYDPIDMGVYEVSFTGKYERTKKFLKSIQPLLCPENYITDAEYDYIFQKFKEKTSTNQDYDMGPDYELEIDIDDNQDNSYIEYTAVIKVNSFISGFY